MAKWEYCEVYVTNNGLPADKNTGAWYTFTEDGLKRENVKYYALMMQLGRDGWELVSSMLITRPGMLGPDNNIIHTFKRPLVD